jgi:indole-3-glycerol phosphate synthase
VTAPLAGQPNDFLAGMAQASRLRLAEARARTPASRLVELVSHLAPPPPLRLSSQGFDLIAELKLRSPALGTLRDAGGEDIRARVLDYAGAGAAAVSVLTEPTRFDGSLRHLEQAAVALGPGAVPAMRKDFLVDPYQVLEARASGAGGVLVILRMLARPVLEALVDQALALRMFVLLEAFDEADAELAHALVEARPQAGDALLVGLNCRDLVTLQVVPGRLEALVDRLPASAPRVAESGLETAADAARLAAAGYDLALVGGALMREGDPRRLAGEMLAAARDARGGRARVRGASAGGAHGGGG